MVTPSAGARTRGSRRAGSIHPASGPPAGRPWKPVSANRGDDGFGNAGIPFAGTPSGLESQAPAGETTRVPGRGAEIVPDAPNTSGAGPPIPGVHEHEREPQGRFTLRNGFARVNPVRSNRNGGGRGNGAGHGRGHPGNAGVPPASIPGGLAGPFAGGTPVSRKRAVPRKSGGHRWLAASRSA